MEKLAGAKLRIVWLEGARLMAFDSVQPSKPKVMHEGTGIDRPLIAPDGATVIFSEGGKIHALTWSANDDRILADGFAAAVWHDPEAKEDWICAAPSAAGENLFRFLLRDPERRQLIWDKAPIDPHTLQLSRDGKIFAAVFFGRDFGIADIAGGWWRKQMSQQNALLAPDNSYVSAMLDGTRRRLRIYRPDCGAHEAFFVPFNPPITWQLELPSQPALSGRDLTGMRWTNHPRLLAVTTSAPGSPARVGVVQLSAGLNEPGQVALISCAGLEASQPDAWVGGGETVELENFPQAVSVSPPVCETPDGRFIRWPRTYDGVHFLWEDELSTNMIPGRPTPCRVTPRGIARFDEWGSMRLDGGTFEADIESARALAASVAQANEFSLDVVLSETIDQRVPFSTRIAALQLDDDRDAFSLSRVGETIVLRVLLQGNDGSPAREYQTLMTPVAVGRNRAMHIRATIKDGEVFWSLDNQGMAGKSELGPPSLAAWRADRVKRLIFGDPNPQGTAGWHARLDHVLARTTQGDWMELRDNVANALRFSRERLLARSVRIRARLLELAPPPASPARQARELVQQVYDVVEVVSGKYEGKRLSVLHWATLDGEATASRPTQPGRVYELLVAAADHHPELESEPIHLGPEEFRLPLYFDLSTPNVPPVTCDEKK
jgi:hypothetical protein